MAEKAKTKFPHLLNPGHTACAGCGLIIAMRNVVDAAGKNTIIVNATGCSEVTTSNYPLSSWKIPWVHSLFENTAAVASGVLAALKIQKKEKTVKVIAQGGDGASFDIGLGFISGMFTRQEDILYICYDNEGYMNTGYQYSGATNMGAATSTTPAGKNSFGNDLPKKDMVSIALAHKCPYVATATVGNVVDLQNKVKKALQITGPKYLQVLVPCVPGWKIDPKITVKLARLAQASGLYPVVEFVDGVLTSCLKVPKPRPKVEEYLILQKRFKHLFAEGNKEHIAMLQKLADENIAKFSL